MTGAELTQELSARGWTQRAFAAHLGMSLRQILRWVGEVQVPRYVELIVRQLPTRERVAA